MRQVGWTVASGAATVLIWIAVLSCVFSALTLAVAAVASRHAERQARSARAHLGGDAAHPSRVSVSG